MTNELSPSYNNRNLEKTNSNNSSMSPMPQLQSASLNTSKKLMNNDYVIGHSPSGNVKKKSILNIQQIVSIEA